LSLPESLPANAQVRLYNTSATPELFAWLEKQSPRSIGITLSDSLGADCIAMTGCAGPNTGNHRP